MLEDIDKTIAERFWIVEWLERPRGERIDA